MDFYFLTLPVISSPSSPLPTFNERRRRWRREAVYVKVFFQDIEKARNWALFSHIESTILLMMERR